MCGAIPSSLEERIRHEAEYIVANAESDVTVDEAEGVIRQLIKAMDWEVDAYLPALVERASRETVKHLASRPGQPRAANLRKAA